MEGSGANLKIQFPVELKVIDRTNAKCLADIGNPSIGSLFAGSRDFFGYNRKVRNIYQCISNQERILADLFNFTIVQVGA